MPDIKRAIALGFFDGVHVGHAALLNKAKQRAAEIGAVPSVLSFDVHPDKLVFGNDVKLINSAASRESIIRKNFDIQDIVFIHFNNNLMHMPWQQFINNLIEEFNVQWIVIGHDFCCGDRGAGKAALIKEYCEGMGIGCDIIQPVCIDGIRVNSTMIRELIANGEMEEANKMLGHPHMLSDTVHTGYHLGVQLGAPTINMFFPEGTVIPKYGVYAARVFLDDGSCYGAVTNVGVRPTVSNDNRVSVESHLLNYKGNLYGRQVMVEFLSFLRPEKKFDNPEELAQQIHNDAIAAEEYLNK